MPGQDLKSEMRNKVGVVGVPFSKGQVRLHMHSVYSLSLSLSPSLSLRLAPVSSD